MPLPADFLKQVESFDKSKLSNDPSTLQANTSDELSETENNVEVKVPPPRIQLTSSHVPPPLPPPVFTPSSSPRLTSQIQNLSVTPTLPSRPPQPIALSTVSLSANVPSTSPPTVPLSRRASFDGTPAPLPATKPMLTQLTFSTNLPICPMKPNKKVPDALILHCATQMVALSPSIPKLAPSPNSRLRAVALPPPPPLPK